MKEKHKKNDQSPEAIVEHAQRMVAALQDRQQELTTELKKKYQNLLVHLISATQRRQAGLGLCLLTLCNTLVRCGAEDIVVTTLDAMQQPVNEKEPLANQLSSLAIADLLCQHIAYDTVRKRKPTTIAQQHKKAYENDLRKYSRYLSKTQRKTTPILTLSKDMVNLIAFDYLPAKDGKSPTDTAHLAITCKFFARYLQPKLNQQAETLAQNLVQHVVHGEKAAVKKMLDASPGLLLHRATVMDYSGRTIKNASGAMAVVYH